MKALKNHLPQAFFLFLTFLLGTVTLMATPNGTGTYRLRAGKNHAFSLVIDGQRIPELRREHVLQLTPGIHRIKVRIPPPSYMPWADYRTIYRGRIEVKPNTEILAYINRHGNLIIYKELAMQPTMPPRGQHSPPPSDNPYHNYNNNNDNNNHHHHGGHDNPYGPNYSDDDAYYGQFPSDDDEDDSPRPNAPTQQHTTPKPAPAAMPADKLTELKSILRGKAFDDERLAIAKQAVSVQQPLLSEQLRELLTTFSFEQTRLDFAQYARPFVSDRENFQVIYSEFKFSSSIKALTQ